MTAAKLSPIAAQALAQMHSILGMDANPARFDWARQIGEADYVMAERRRVWLVEAGCSGRFSACAWDDLPAGVRAKLSGVEA